MMNINFQRVNYLTMSANVLLTESMSLEVGAQEPWPSNVQLFQPYEVITLPILLIILTAKTSG